MDLVYLSIGLHCRRGSGTVNQNPEAMCRMERNLLICCLGLQISLINLSIAISPDPRALGNTFMDDDDSLGVPEWLQNIPMEQKVLKYRKRRFISTASTLLVTPRLFLPPTDVKGLRVRSNWDTTLTFRLPASVAGRSSWEQLGNRTDFFKEFENFFEGFGFHGPSCLLKTICELTHLPFDFGLLGEITNFLFGINNSYDDPGNVLPEEEEYRKARENGRNSGNCNKPYPNCPISALGFVSKIESL